MTDGDQPVAATNVPLMTPPGLALDPIVALTTSVHASPGVYALLLGSGVSTGAGVLTGWQIVADLVRKVAAIQDPGNIDAAREAGDNPEEWWTQHGDGQSLGYSTLLGALAPTPAARQALLAGFFEPTDDDRDRDLKVPSRAHRAIAQLVARGAVRVILTTNFDRLTERALEDVGVPPQVLHRTEQLSSATPLAHARVTVIKLHGDYADLEQRNTVDELAKYPENLADYVGRVMDEYGLIVSGWSGEWDTALVRSLEEMRSRRYPLFWSSYGAIGENAQHLISQHGAVSLAGQTADELFTGLADRLDALDRLATIPITTDIAVEQLKRALPDPKRRIELFDLVDSQVQRLASQIKDRNRHPLDGMSLNEQRDAYEAESISAARLLATGVFHGDSSQAPVWLRALQRLMSVRDSFAGSFSGTAEAMRHYPALLCLWAMGLAAILAKHEQFLARLLLEAKWTAPYGDQTPQPPVRCLNPVRIVFADDDRAPDGALWMHPQSHHVRVVSRDVLKELEPDDAAYQRACDRFEYLASLISMDETASGPNRFPWKGEFLLERRRRIAVEVEKEITAGWPLLEGGAFGGEFGRAISAHSALNEWMSKQSSWLSVAN